MKLRKTNNIIGNYVNWLFLLNVLIILLVQHFPMITVVRGRPTGRCGKYGFKCLNQTTYEICNSMTETKNGDTSFSFTDDIALATGKCPIYTKCDENYAFYCSPEQRTTELTKTSSGHNSKIARRIQGEYISCSGANTHTEDMRGKNSLALQSVAERKGRKSTLMNSTHSRYHVNVIGKDIRNVTIPTNISNSIEKTNENCTGAYHNVVCSCVCKTASELIGDNMNGSMVRNSAETMFTEKSNYTISASNVWPHTSCKTTFSMLDKKKPTEDMQCLQIINLNDAVNSLVQNTTCTVIGEKFNRSKSPTLTSYTMFNDIHAQSGAASENMMSATFLDLLELVNARDLIHSFAPTSSDTAVDWDNSDHIVDLSNSMANDLREISTAASSKRKDKDSWEVINVEDLINSFSLSTSTEFSEGKVNFSTPYPLIRTLKNTSSVKSTKYDNSENISTHRPIVRASQQLPSTTSAKVMNLSSWDLVNVKDLENSFVVNPSDISVYGESSSGKSTFPTTQSVGTSSPGTFTKAVDTKYIDSWATEDTFPISYNDIYLGTETDLFNAAVKSLSELYVTNSIVSYLNGNSVESKVEELPYTSYESATEFDQKNFNDIYFPYNMFSPSQNYQTTVNFIDLLTDGALTYVTTTAASTSETSRKYDLTNTEKIKPLLTSQFTCTAEGIYSDPVNDAQYYVCEISSDGAGFITIPGVCPKGKVFVPSAYDCVNPSLIGVDSPRAATQTRSISSNITKLGEHFIFTPYLGSSADSNWRTGLPEEKIVEERHARSTNHSTGNSRIEPEFEVRLGDTHENSTSFDSLTSVRYPDHIDFNITRCNYTKFNQEFEKPQRGDLHGIYTNKYVRPLVRTHTTSSRAYRSVTSKRNPRDEFTFECGKLGRFADPICLTCYYLCYRDIACSNLMNVIRLCCPSNMTFDVHTERCVWMTTL